MPPWSPGDPWPGTPGGATSPRWGGYITLFVRAGLAPGTAFHMGAHAADRLDSGNVLAGGAAVGRTETDRLWVDLSCDVLDLEIAGGASSSDGIFSKADAATLVAKLADPLGIYDPYSSSNPFVYGGHSRLVPGTPIEAWAEVVNGDTGTVTTHWLFTGTADRWGEDWTPTPSKRQAVLVASDGTKTWARYDRPEQPAEGAGDTTAARAARLVTYYGWPGTVEASATSSVTLQATTLAANGWELLNRTLDDELGFVYFTGEGALRWLDRTTWTAPAVPVLELGCPSVPGAEDAYDVLIEANPAVLDEQIRNAVYAARTGGTTQTAISESSRERFGEHDYKRTDLGLATDAQAGAWAAAVLILYAYPQLALENVTLVPAVAARSFDVWRDALNLDLVSDPVRIVWAPPDLPENVVDITARVVGVRHSVTRTAWELEWQLTGTGPAAHAGSIFTLGPHAQDRLDAGYILT